MLSNCFLIAWFAISKFLYDGNFGHSLIQAQKRKIKSFPLKSWFTKMLHSKEFIFLSCQRYFPWRRQIAVVSWHGVMSCRSDLHFNLLQQIIWFFVVAQKEKNKGQSITCLLELSLKHISLLFLPSTLTFTSMKCPTSVCSHTQ